MQESLESISDKLFSRIIVLRSIIYVKLELY